MIPRDVLQKIRRIQITTNRLVTDVFAGQYHSVFKGRGMEFDEVREYQIGDDVRSIDWNVTARTGKAYIKKYVEEREMTVMLMVDASRSTRFATRHELKSRLAAEIAAVLAFSAIRNNDKVGLMMFTDHVEKFIPPRRGTQHVLRVIREVLYFQPSGRKTDLVAPLEYLNKVLNRKAVAFLISDFLDVSPEISRNGGKLALRSAMAISNRRHDLIAVTLTDPAEAVLPDCGLIEVEDAETGEHRVIDSCDPALRRAYEETAARVRKERQRLFRSIGMDEIELSSARPYANDLVKFFLQRRRRR